MSDKRIYRFIKIAALTVFLTCLASCAAEPETNNAPPAIDPARTQAALAASENLFRERNTAASAEEAAKKIREAVATLAQVRNPNGRVFEVEWKFAKYNFFLGRQTTDSSEADKAFADGAAAARIASRIEENKPDGHFWYAANLGEQAKKSPVTVGLKAVSDIRAALEKAIAIDPAYQNASAFDALAQIELATNLTGGKPEKAIEFLEKALTYEKNNAAIYLHLAEAYLANGKKPEAKKQLEYILAMKPSEDYRIEHEQTVEKAKKLLETKF